MEIHEGRANANKLMVRFVRKAIAECGAQLVSWEGGNMRNAIPFKAEVVLTMPQDKAEAVKALVVAYKACFCDEYKTIEPGLEFFTEVTALPSEVGFSLRVRSARRQRICVLDKTGVKFCRRRAASDAVRTEVFHVRRAVNATAIIRVRRLLAALANHARVILEYARFRGIRVVAKMRQAF